MSIINLPDGWMRFGEGRSWRCIGPKWMVEVDWEGNIPSYKNLTASVNKIRRVKSFYRGRLSFGLLDANGNALDLITANAMAESLGSVPSSLEFNELKKVLSSSPSAYPGDRLNAVIDYTLQKEKYLARKEPGYVNPITTPGRASAGSHHILFSTALSLLGKQNDPTAIEDLVLRLPSGSVFAANLAVKYFTNSYAKHMLQPPLMAAVYNAGGIRPSSANVWNLVQYGNHLDRWVSFYNTSRLV